VVKNELKHLDIFLYILKVRFLAVWCYWQMLNAKDVFGHPS